MDLSQQVTDAASILADCADEDHARTHRENLQALLRAAESLGQDPSTIDLGEPIAAAASNLAKCGDPNAAETHRTNLSFLVDLVTRTTEAAKSDFAAHGERDVRDQDDLLTTTEAATALGISRPTLMRLVSTNQLDHVMVGSHHRIPAGSLLEYKASRLVSRETVSNEQPPATQDPGSTYRKTTRFGEGGDLV